MQFMQSQCIKTHSLGYSIFISYLLYARHFDSCWNSVGNKISIFPTFMELTDFPERKVNNIHFQ